MRVLDFLALIKTLHKNTLFYFETTTKAQLPIVSFEVLDDKLYLTTAKNQHPRQKWELFVLLQKKELLPHLLYVQDDQQQLQPIFGFRFDNGKALLQ